MRNFGYVLFEMELRKKQIEAELEQARLVRLAKATRPQTKRRWGFWHTAIRLRDRVMEVRCEVQSLFATKPTPATC